MPATVESPAPSSPTRGSLESKEGPTNLDASARQPNTRPNRPRLDPDSRSLRRLLLQHQLAIFRRRQGLRADAFASLERQSRNNGGSLRKFATKVFGSDRSDST